MTGNQIGHYKILEKVGEGGMGVVYKAHDMKLDRIVALKFLPHGLGSHEPERERFLQEARAASALNHPNVCVIHDIQESDGEQFIVMEFVDGVTLRNKIEAFSHSTGQLAPLDTVLSYATQIGEALQEAHAKGIVHRDVKAENIMVTPRNQIKVMDFGLAKLKGALKLTRTSSTVGTLAYMAPEQIQGGEVDARSDIFSFGVVLYEMITGQVPFGGDHEAAMMYSILNSDPEPAERYRPNLPSELLHILYRSLEKIPDDRYQSMSEMVIDLRRMKRQSARVTRPVMSDHFAPVAETPTSVTLSVQRKSKRQWIALGATAILIIAVAGWLLTRLGGSSNSTLKLNPNMTFRVLNVPYSQLSYPGLSRDGNWIAFPAAGADGRWDIYFMNALGGEAHRVTTDSSMKMSQADISPDGSRIAYDRFDERRGRAEVAVVSSLGGMSRVIASPAILPRWTPSGDRVGFVRGSGTVIPSASNKVELWTVGADGSNPRLEFVDSIGVASRFSYAWSPDQKFFAWIRSFREGYQELIVVELASGKTQQLTSDRRNLDEVCWTRQGEIVFSSNRSGNMNLWMISPSGGQPVQLTRGSGPDFGMKISADGTKLLYYQQLEISNIWLANIDGSDAHALTNDERRLNAPSLSPDGKMVAFEQWGTDPTKTERSIDALSIERAVRHEITAGLGIAALPRWSPDGKWIAFLTRTREEPRDSMRVAIVDAADPGVPRILAMGSGVLWLNPFELAVIRGSSGQYQTSIVPIDGGPARIFGADSTVLIPVVKAKFALSIPQRVNAAARIIPVSEAGLDVGHARILEGGVITTAALSLENNYALIHNGQDQFIKVMLPSGKREILAVKYPGFDVLSPFNLSRDGRKIVYTDIRQKGNLVMIENLR